MSPGWTSSRAQSPALRDHADTGGGDVDAVRCALADDLGVAGDDLYAGPGRGFAHVGDDFAEFVDRKALLDDEGGRQPLRASARYREVVDGAVHGDVADRTAWKAPRRNDIGVGGERQPVARRGAKRGGVAELFEFVVAERLEEHRVDERRRRLAAGAVRERHHFFEQPRASLPELVDPFQHAVFALAAVIGSVVMKRVLRCRTGAGQKAMCSWATDHSRYPSMAWLS